MLDFKVWLYWTLWNKKCIYGHCRTRRCRHFSSLQTLFFKRFLPKASWDFSSALIDWFGKDFQRLSCFQLLIQIFVAFCWERFQPISVFCANWTLTLFLCIGLSSDVICVSNVWTDEVSLGLWIPHVSKFIPPWIWMIYKYFVVI